jgi:hypothetical protein
MELTRRERELDTDTWLDAFTQAAALGRATKTFASCPIDREIGVRSEQPVGKQPGVPAAPPAHSRQRARTGSSPEPSRRTPTG